MDLRIAVISILVASSLSGPVKNLNSNTKCAVQCTNKDKFSYRPGTVYEYSYEAETKTGIPGATEEQGGLKVIATAEIEVVSKCELLLTVKNSDILGSDPDYPRQFRQTSQQREFQQQLENYSLRFSFQDGIVEEVCPDDNDSEWSVNLKRGLLSAFQNSMESFEMETEVIETDVSGICRTSYRVIQEGWQTIKVKKIKDLASCTNRHGFQTSAQATIYSIPFSVQSIPLLKSTQECDQVVNVEGRVQSTVCHEIHIFRPFSKNDNGATTEVTQKLQFVTEKRGGQLITDTINKRQTLLYHHHGMEMKKHSNKDAAINKLNELCISTKDGIQSDTPRHFTDLVYILKELNIDDLTDIYEQSQMESFCLDNADRIRKFYNDAVPMIGTTAAVKQISKLILSNEISGTMAEIWLSSLSLVQNPSAEMLAEISKLIDLPEGIKVYLPASVMVNTYCRKNPNCENVPEVQDLVTKLQRAVGSRCIITEGNYLQVLTALRAIGNLEMADRMVPIINECIEQKSNDMEIRVTAVEAYRKMSCGADRNNLMILYRDITEDSELRIAAYIQSMKCPNEFIINQVKDTLTNEEVNQVGSFVWTHLTNLMESSSVHKQPIQSILEDEVLKKEFDLDKRKFSRNYEWSYFSDRMNAGAGLESNIIWSQKSFVPRTAMVNLTVDLFGHSVNLFEIGGRVEGLEKILIENFGPKGFFGAKQDITPQQKMTRDIDFNKVKRIDENLGKKDDDFKGSMYVRVFGNEISYYNTKQSLSNNIPESKKFNFLEMFMSLAKEQEFSQKMSKMLIDSSIITPTITGLPLNLKATATSTVDMNAKGKMDLRSPSKSIIMEGSINPSGAIEVSCEMNVVAFATKSGLKMNSRLYTSTGVSARFELDKKQEMTMEFDILKEKSEILKVKSDFSIVHADHEKELNMITRKRITKQSCSGATIARVTGVELCIDMSLPDQGKVDVSHFPLSGPAKLELTVLKKDTHKNYKFEWKNIMEKKKSVLLIMYDTPGSKIMRKTGLQFEMDHQNKNMEINMISPWKTAKFEGSLQNKAKRKKVVGTISVDSKTLYQTEASVLITETKLTKSYKPKIEIIRPNEDPIVLGGDIVYKPGKVMTSKLVLTGAMDKPATLDLSARLTKAQYGMTASLLYNKDQKYTAHVNLETNDKPKRTVYSPTMIFSVPEKDYINLKGTVEFKQTKGKTLRYEIVVDKLFKEPVKLKGESSLQVKGRRNIYKGKVYFTGPKKISTRIRYLFDKKQRVTTTSVKLDYNFQKVLKNLKDNIQFNSKLLKRNVKNMQKISFNSNVKSARLAEYNNQLNLQIDHRPNYKLDADLTVDYGKNYMAKANKYRVSLLTKSKFNIKPNAGTINYNVTFKLPAENIDCYFSGSNKYTQKQLKSDLHIRYDNKKSAVISVDLMNLSSKKYFKYSGDVALKYGGRHIQMSGLAVEKSDEYSTKWSVQHQEEHMSFFSAVYSWPNNETRQIASSVRIDQQLPITVTGSILTNKKKPEGTIKVKFGKDFYVVSGMGEYDGETYVKGLGKVAYPSRQIIVETEGGFKRKEYLGKVDVNWDARDKQEKSRVVVEGMLRNNSLEDFTVSTFIKYPYRELSAKIEHNSVNKLDTLVSVGWNKNKAISVKVNFEKDIRKYQHRIGGFISANTPFKSFQEFEIGGNYAKKRNKLECGSTFTWNAGRTAAFQYETKLPVDVSNIAMKLDLKTPSSIFGNPTIKLQMKLSDDINKLEGSTKLTWGNGKFVFIETDGNSQFEGPKRKLQQNVAVLTSFEDFKVTTLNFTHEDDSNKFFSKAVYIKDGIKYLYIIDMNHVLDGWSMQNSGTFDISSPYDSLTIAWSHINKDNNLETIVNTDWGSGQRFFAKVIGKMESHPNRKYEANLEMKIPSSEFSSLIVGVEHEDKVGFVNSVCKVIANKENVGTMKLNYARQLGSTDFDFRVTSKYIKDFIIDGKTRHAHLPMTGSLKIEWNPLKRIFLDGSLNYDGISTIDSNVELITPFHQAKKVLLKASHKLDNLDWVAQTELEFAPRKKINAELRYNTGVGKMARLQITTPFPQLSKLNMGTYHKFLLGADQWENKMDFEIVPLVGKISSGITWQHNTKTKGTFRLDTPFTKIPYMSAEVESEMVLGKRNSRFVFEYLPNQKIELASEYTLKNGGELDGFISLKTPFNEEISALYRQEGYKDDKLTGFQRKVQLKYSRTQNIIVHTTFGTSPKMFGSIELKMPIRGYETVKLSFSHEGNSWKYFQTELEYETNGKKIEMEAHLDILNDIQGKVLLRSPFESVRLVQMEYTHSGNPQNFKTDISAVFNEYKIESNTIFVHNKEQTTGSFTLKSPIEVAKDVMLSFNKDGDWKKFTFNGEFGYERGSKYIVGIKHDFKGKDASMEVVIQSPLTEDIIMKLSHNSLKKGFRTVIIQGLIGSDNSLLLETTYKLKNYDLELKTNLKTVISGEVKNSNFVLEHKGQLNDFTCIAKFKTSYFDMDDEVKLSFKGSMDDIDANIEIRDTMKSVSLVTGIKLLRKDNKIITEAKYNENIIKSEISTVHPKYHGKISAVTKIKGYENFEVEFDHVGENHQTTNKVTIKPFSNKPIVLESDILFKGVTLFEVEMKFSSGFEGFKNIESKITHSGNSRDFTSNFEFRKSNMIPLKLEASVNSLILTDIDASLKFTSGIKGFEAINTIFQQQSLENDAMQKIVIVAPFAHHLTQTQVFKRRTDSLEFVYELVSSIKSLENVQVKVVHSGPVKKCVNTVTINASFMESLKLVTKTDINDDFSEVDGQIRLISSLKGAEDIHLTFTNIGTLTDFSNKLAIKPPYMDEIELTSSVKYKKRQNMQINVNFSSKITGVESLEFSTNNRVSGSNTVTSKTDITLDKLGKITIDATGNKKGNEEISLVFDVETPFQKLRTFNIDYLSTRNSKNQFEENVMKEMLSVSYNGEKYWDTKVTANVINGKSYICNFNMDQPKQAEYSQNVQLGEPFSFDILVNWNKLEPSSNFKFESSLENMNDLKVKVIHPLRTMIVEGALINETEKTIRLIVTYDEEKNHAIGIESKWQKNRQGLDMMDGSVKVVTPWRSVEVQGSVNKVFTRKSVETTVFWDSEKDRTKKMSVFSEMTPDINGYTGRLQMSLPVIGKDLKLMRQFSENDGDILYETRTEFSYSTDPSKTIIFTTKLEDLSESGSNNHSYTFGVQQAFAKIDTTISAHLGRSSRRDSIGMFVKYKTSELQQKNFMLMAEIDKLHKKIILLNVGPRKSVGLVGQLLVDSPVTISVRGLHALKDVVEADVIVDSKKKAVELQMKYDKANPNNVLHVAAKYPSETNLEVQIYRTGEKPQTTDSVIKIDLKTTRILHSKMSWRPHLIKDLMNYGVKVVEDYGKSASNEFTVVARNMEQELTTKYTAISSELERELQPFIDSISTYLISIQRQLRVLRKHANEMYKDNNMYVKDVADGLHKKTSTAIKMYKKAVIQMQDTVSDIRKKLADFKNLKEYAFEEKYKELVNDITSKLETYKEKAVVILKEQMETITIGMKDRVEAMRRDVQSFRDKMKIWILDLLDDILDKAEVKELMSYIDDMLKNLPDSSKLADIDWKYYSDKINKAIKQKLLMIDLEKTYNDVIEKTQNTVTEQLRLIMQDEKIQDLKELAEQLQKKITWAYKRWNMENALKGYLTELYNDLQTYIKEDIAALKFLHLEKNRIIAFDPENGNIEFELYLPTPMDTLESLPKFSLHKYARKVDKMIKKIDSLGLPKLFDISFWDLYYKYKPSWDPKKWVPPFDAFAMVVGGQHFITFDQRQIDFAGRCSYVLVKDMVDNQFTVIINYNGKRRPEMKSLLILAEGRSVEIGPDFSVKIDNRPTELPIKHEKLRIMREGNLVQIDTGRGLEISGNLVNQHIAFVISGWYFGKVGGILGNYNNEQYDDMIDRSGQITSNVSTSAQSWEVTKRCRNSANIASTVKVEEGQKGYKKCFTMFKDTDSTLRPCFNVVDPVYFMKVCMAEMQTSKGDGCNAVAAYVKQCRINDVLLWEPKMCVTCSAPNDELFEGGETIKLSYSSNDFQVPNSADVVIVVEQISCNSNPAQHLGDLVDKIEQAFANKKIKNNRYGLIGFGGTPRHINGRQTSSLTHTFEGKIFSESSNFAKGKETLKFSYHFTDPLEALMTAADMPFRTGVSKTIVLLQCGECSQSKNTNFIHLKHVLMTRDITLHIIRDQDIRLKGNSSPKDVIMGFDNRRKFMMKPLKDMSSGDIEKPDDACVALSQSTDGTLFHSAGLVDTKLRKRKWFLSTVSRRISQTALPDKCQVCQCIADHTGMAKSICRTCYSSVSDYLPDLWNTVRHPTKIQDQFEKQYKDYFGTDTWKVYNR